MAERRSKPPRGAGVPVQRDSGVVQAEIAVWVQREPETGRYSSHTLCCSWNFMHLTFSFGVQVHFESTSAFEFLFKVPPIISQHTAFPLLEYSRENDQY